MSYRIRYVSDGGPVHSDNMHGWPTHGKTHRTLLGVLKELRDVVNSDVRIGKTLGVAVQYRFFNEAWRYMSARETDKTASEMRIRGWKPLCEVAP